MRTIIAFISLTVGFALQAAPPATKAVIHPSQYSAAEAVYRSFLPGAQWPESKANFVYCLSFGNSDAPVPSEFMARFAGPMPTVITGTNRLAFPMPGVMRECQSGREVVRLMLRSLGIRGDHAKAKVIYTTGSQTVTVALELSQQDGRWNVTRMKEGARSEF